MEQQLQPTPEAIAARQAKMQEVWDGIKEKTKPENDNQMAQSLAFAIVDMVEYVNDLETSFADDRKFMEEVIYRTNMLSVQNLNLMQALNLAATEDIVRDVFTVEVDNGKYNIVRVQDKMVLGTFGRELAETLVVKLNTPPTLAEVADESGNRAEVPSN